jgi:hypothetical protein
MAGAVAISRFAFRTHSLYDLDSVNFALGIARFDPRVHQPHPPGYFLYICLGRLLNYAANDPNLALVILSILASIACVILIYKLALDWFGPRAATFAGLLFLFSPLAWFHGTVALTYSVECAASALIGSLCWRIDRGKTAFIVPTAIALGVTAGIRPSSILFLGPLFLFSIRGAGLNKQLLGILSLGAATLAWFLPMISASGGFAAYFGALSSLWHMVPSKDTIYNSSPVTSIARAIIIVFIYFLCFGAACLAPLGASCGTAPADKSKKLFTLVWIAPGLCFFTFIFLKLVNSGYLLVVFAPGCVWLGAWTSCWYESGPWQRAVKIFIAITCAATNVLIFAAFPAYFSYRSVRHFETELTQTEAALPQVGSPKDVLIVSFDNHFLGYRHAGYYLPDYLTVEYPEANLVEGRRVFAMQGRNSFLLKQLPSAPYSRFVLFPLPAGQPEFEQYLAKVEKSLPGKDLTTVELEGHPFVTAPIEDLRFLFPHTAVFAHPPSPGTAPSGLAPNVYTPRSIAPSHP